MVTFVRSLLALSCVLFLAAGCSSSTDPGTSTTPRTNKQSIIGTVSSTSGVAIAQAAVYLSRPDSVMTTTDAQGAFRIDSVSPGSYTIYARATGFKDAAQTVRIDSGANTNVSLTLSPASAAGPTVTVQLRSAETGETLRGLVSVFNDPPFYNYINKYQTDANGQVTYQTDTAGWYFFVGQVDGYNIAVDSVDTRTGSGPFAIILSLPKLPAPPAEVWADSLIACYRFSNSLVDSSGHSLDGSRHGGVFVADRFGNAASAMQFNGTTDYMLVADNPQLNFGKDENFTVTMWVNYSTPSFGNTLYLFYKAIENSIFTGYAGGIDGYPRIQAQTGTTYGEDHATEYATTGDNRWHLLTYEFDRSGTIKVSVDGQSFTYGSAEYLDGNINTNAPLLIGGNTKSGYYFKGKIDDVRIYHGLLPTTYLDSLYHEYGW